MILKKIYDLETLNEAWKEIRLKRPTPGIDRVRVEDFEKNLDANLKKLHQEIKKENYSPLPVMIYKDRKTKGKIRNIGISTLRDRVVQQAVLIHLKPHFESRFLPCSYAYRPKKSAGLAVKQAGKCIQDGRVWCLKMDVKQFFDSINHEILLKLISRVIEEKPLLRLVSRMLKAKIFKEMGLFDNTLGSQQGSGLSPLLSNIYLHPLDMLMWKKFKDSYQRFSDDIAVFTQERETLDEARSLIERGLMELKLSVNPPKTSIAHVSGGVIYLGFYLDLKGMGPSRKSIDQLHEKLENLTPVRRTDNIKDRLAKVDQQIRGWYNYYKSVKALTPPNILSMLSLVRISKDVNEIRYAKDILRQHEIFPHNHPEISFHLGELFYELGMHARATREYARSLELDPGTNPAKDRIRKLQTQESDLHKAIEKTKMVLHHNPHYREGYEKLAEYYTKLGLYGFAEKATLKALELDSDSKLPVSVENRSVSENGIEQKNLKFEKVDLENFLSIFSGRADAHGRQWVDERGKYGFIRVERPLKTKDVYKHLEGEETLAVYPVTTQDTVNFIVFDIDISKRIILQSDEPTIAIFMKKTHDDISRIKGVCQRMGLVLYIEDSGYKGRHGWLFFSQEIPASRAILLGNEIIKRAGSPSDGIAWELFPRGKIERQNNRIKLPMGINKKNNRRCPFLNDKGSPVQDHASFLNTIKKNDISALKIPGDIPIQTDEIFSAKENKIIAPPGIDIMANRCGIIKHLISKVRDTNYLNHYERICLLYTLTFAGEEGSKFLHKVIGYCINYDYYHTQRYIDRRKESPISCARIKENFFDLAESFCTCKFKLPPRSYPSPVLYLLEAELETVTVKTVFSKENISERPDSNSDEAGKKDDNMESTEESVLNFEDIFSDESKELTELGNGEEIKPKIQEDTALSLIESDEGIFPENIQKPEKDEIPDKPPTLPDFKISIPDEPDIHPESSLSDSADDIEQWGLFLEYLKLHHESVKVETKLNEITGKLNNMFNEMQTDTLSTRIGTLERICGKNGAIQWELKC